MRKYINKHLLAHLHSCALTLLYTCTLTLANSQTYTLTSLRRPILVSQDQRDKHAGHDAGCVEAWRCGGVALMLTTALDSSASLVLASRLVEMKRR